MASHVIESLMENSAAPNAGKAVYGEDEESKKNFFAVYLLFWFTLETRIKFLLLPIETESSFLHFKRLICFPVASFRSNSNSPSVSIAKKSSSSQICLFPKTQQEGLGKCKRRAIANSFFNQTSQEELRIFSNF